MKIKAKMLSNESLVAIVEAVIEARLLPDDLILKYYQHGLVTQVKTIKRQLENIEKEAKNKKITRKKYALLRRKEQQLCSLGNKKIAILKELENATN